MLHTRHCMHCRIQTALLAACGRAKIHCKRTGFIECVAQLQSVSSKLLMRVHVLVGENL